MEDTAKQNAKTVLTELRLTVHSPVAAGFFFKVKG